MDPAREGVGLVGAGTVLAGRYLLEQRIASGGMGQVWRAVDRVLGRTVAVKCLLPAPADEPRFVDRFRAEARTMATISHPGVVEVYDFGDDPDAGMYLVMKYIEGESLAHALARVGRLGAEATMRLVAQAAEALHAAHDKGVTHRDVKPGNLLLRSDGEVLLTDFGIARSAAAAGHTVDGSLLGTAGYMAPERATGQPATARSDLYSLGVVAYRCLAGRLPFEADTPLEVALRHINDEPPALPEDVPPEVRAVVERAMAKDPAARWPSGAVLAAEARRALTPAPPQRHVAVAAAPTQRQPTIPTVTEEQLGPAPRRTRWPIVAALVVVAVITTAAVLLNRRDDAQPRTLPDNNTLATNAATPENIAATPIAASVAPASSAASPTPTRPKAGAGTTPPAPPKNLTATPISASTIRLRWSDDSANEDGFSVTNGVTSRGAATNATTMDWTGLAPATRSCFKVRAHNASGVSAYHPAAEADWVCATSLSGTGPAAPANLTATAIGTGTIRLQWTDASADEDGFTVINGATSRDAAANATSLNWSGLAPNTYMCFKIRAFNSSGVSAYHPTAEQEWVCVTTPAT